MKAVAEVKYLIAALARKIAGSEIYYHPVNVCIALNGLQGVCVLICQTLCGSVAGVVVVGWRGEKCSGVMHLLFMHDLSLRFCPPLPLPLSFTLSFFLASATSVLQPLLVVKYTALSHIYIYIHTHTHIHTYVRTFCRHGRLLSRGPRSPKRSHGQINISWRTRHR